jgi:hypothetical protein
VLASRLAVAPAVTVAVGRYMRAVRVPPDHPAARRSSFGGDRLVSWAVANTSGTPCFPGHYDDVTRRTVDVRPPAPGAGHAHPRRVLVFAGPPLGFFAPGHSARRGAPPGTPRTAERVVDTEGDHVLEDEHVGTLRVTAGRVTLIGCTVERLEAADGVHAETCRLGSVAVAGRARLERCTLIGSGEFGVLSASRSLFAAADDEATGPVVTAREHARLNRCAVESLEVGEAGEAEGSAAEAEGSLWAAGSLLGSAAAAGAALLDACTVLRRAAFGTVEASDCLFAGTLEAGGGSVRYSRLPRDTQLPGGRTYAITRAAPVFIAVGLCAHERDEPASAFARPGRGVLDPRTPDAVRFGAEDGGELGAYHERAHSLEQAALVDQVRDHLPHGLEPVVVFDELLHQTPPNPASHT